MKMLLKLILGSTGALLLWQAICILLKIPRYVLPMPSEVIRFALSNWSILLADCAVTGMESIGGFVAGILLSLLTAVFIYFAPRAERTLAAMTIGAQSVPILAIAPFLTAWFGAGIGSKIVASALVCIFPLIGGWITGRNSITPNELVFADSVLPTKWVRLWHFILPRSLPAFVAALKIGCPLSVLGALVGEFVGARCGIGFRILTGSYYLRTEEMVCGVILACLMSLGLYGTVLLGERTWLFWHGKRAS